MNKPDTSLSKTPPILVIDLPPEQIQNLKNLISVTTTIAGIVETLHQLATQMPVEQRNALLHYIQLFILNEAIKNKKFYKDLTDAVTGLLPGFGDVIMPLWVAHNIYTAFKDTNTKPPKELSIVLALKIVDFILGLTPGIGDAGDFVFLSNMASSMILEKLLAQKYLDLISIHNIPEEITQEVVNKLNLILRVK